MTTYILHGGIQKGTNQLLADMSFWPEVVNRMPKAARVLCIYAAIDPERWPEEFVREQNRMAEFTQQYGVILEMGSVKPEDLSQQIIRADVIYIRGGYSNELVKSALMKTKVGPEVLENKIVAGSSAGAYALSKYYHSLHQGIGEGLGFVKCKVIAHYNESRNQELDDLRKFGEQLPIYALKEGEYITIMI